MNSTFRLRLTIPKRPQIEGRAVAREDAFAWIWNHLQGCGLLGVHEGSVLAEAAAKSGLETESWTVDAGLAPRERDWIEAQDVAKAELHFSSADGARKAVAILEAAGFQVGAVEEQKAEDWDAHWRASFLNDGAGVQVPPFWRIVPPWVKADGSDREVILKVNPGAGFGTGTHETTQLCLQSLGENAPLLRTGVQVLDFGSGSGILAVAAARLGGKSLGIEIDPLAIDNARENAVLNGVQGSCVFTETFAEAAMSYHVIVANILKPVLLEFAHELVPRLAPGGILILSGLIEDDVAPVGARYGELLGKGAPLVRKLGDWRSLCW